MKHARSPILALALGACLITALAACHDSPSTAAPAASIVDPVKQAFEAEMPASAVSATLYVDSNGDDSRDTHACDVTYKNGTITTVAVSDKKLPELVSYARNGLEAESETVTVAQLRPAVHQCFANATPVVEFRHALKQ